MAEYTWCHGPMCHKRHTTTRVRGVKGNKVLRTVKIRHNNYRAGTIYSHFCDQTCLHDFINKHIQEFVRLHPRTEALETPILDPVKHKNEYTGWGHTKITVDNERNIG